MLRGAFLVACQMWPCVIGRLKEKNVADQTAVWADQVGNISKRWVNFQNCLIQVKQTSGSTSPIEQRRPPRMR